MPPRRVTHFLRALHHGTFRDSWIRLGLLGGWLALSVLLVHVPAALWAGNVAEFDSAVRWLLALGGTAVLSGLLVVLLVLRLLPPAARAAVACLLCALGLIWWGYGLAFVGRMTVINGQDVPMDFETSLGPWELPLVVVACLVLALAIGRLRRQAMLALLVMNLGLIAATSVAVYTASLEGRAELPPPKDERAAFRFSPKRNVLVVLLDELQADVAGEVLHDRPDLRAAFEGFLFFRDTLGVAPTTFLSVPAIHSGLEYPGHGDLTGYFRESIERRSFVNRFARAGYDTTIVNPVGGVCPTRTATCIRAAQILRPARAQLRLESLRLLDLALFRVSPVWLKERIYNGGQWLIAGRIGVSQEAGLVLDGIRLFEEMAARFALNDGPPTLKFLHSLATHTPYILADDCRSIGPTSLDRLPAQAGCALRAVATLLDRLKQAGVYDDTVVLVLADHGLNPGIFTGAPEGGHEEWTHLAGAANPVFLLKPLGRRGPLQEASHPVHVPDVAATLCAETGDCTAPLGFPAGEAPAHRPRAFVDYVWRHEYWDSGDIPGMTRYEVRGPLWRADSWRRLD